MLKINIVTIHPQGNNDLYTLALYKYLIPDGQCNTEI